MVCALLGCCLALPSGTVVGEEKAKAPATDTAHEEMMAAMMKVATPGPQHAKLRKMAGTWKAVSKHWMGPGEPQITEGTCKNTPILGGRYLMQEYKSAFMDQPFEGLSFLGYDNQKQEFVNVWMDNMGTGMLMSTGRMDEANKVLTMEAEYPNPVSGEMFEMRMVTRIIDDNKHVFEMFEKHEGQEEVKSMEVTYARQ